MSLLRVAPSLVVFAALALAAPAGAASLAFAGTLSIQIAMLPAAGIAGSGVASFDGSSAGGHAGSLALSASVFAATAVHVPVTDPAVAPLEGVLLTAHNDAGAFTGGAGSLGGVLPVRGLARICLAHPCELGPPSNVSIPLSIGLTSSRSTAFFMNLTVQGAPWTSGAISAYGLRASGYAHGPASGTSSTAAPSGVVSLVTPILVSTNVGASPTLPIYARMTLHFVPEPAPAGLLLAGCAALGLAGRRLRTRRE
jgi:hypothetical protein